MRNPARLAAVAILLPLIFWPVYAKIPVTQPPPLVERFASRFENSLWKFQKIELSETEAHPRVAHVQVVDLDRDKTADVLVCDAHDSAVFWYRRSASGEWGRQRLHAEDLVAPGHATVVDIDKDADLDILVSVLGSVWPDNRQIDQVILLQNDGRQNFSTRVVLNDLRRVTDVQPADFDTDGDVDLVVALVSMFNDFGSEGAASVVWLENDGKQNFRQWQIADRPIHQVTVACGDLNGDGHDDIVTGGFHMQEMLYLQTPRERLGGARDALVERFRGVVKYCEKNYFDSSRCRAG